MSFVGSPLSRCFVPIACRRPAQLPARDMGLVCRGIIWFSIVFDDVAFDLCGVLFPDDQDTKPKAVCEVAASWRNSHSFQESRPAHKDH